MDIPGAAALNRRGLERNNLKLSSSPNITKRCHPRKLSLQAMLKSDSSTLRKRGDEISVRRVSLERFESEAE